MLTVILAAAIVTQPKPQSTSPSTALRAGQTAQEQSVVAARRVRKGTRHKTAAARAAREEEADKKERVAFEQAVAAQRAYEHKMGPIWAAQHANEIQAQRNALIAQANQIAKYQADYDIWLRMQSNSINAAIAAQQMRR